MVVGEAGGDGEEKHTDGNVGQAVRSNDMYNVTNPFSIFPDYTCISKAGLS